MRKRYPPSLRPSSWSRLRWSRRWPANDRRQPAGHLVELGLANLERPSAACADHDDVPDALVLELDDRDSARVGNPEFAQDGERGHSVPPRRRGEPDDAEAERRG